MIYITIIICTLFVCATVVAWRYFDEITSLECNYVAKLNDIAFIAAKAKNRHDEYLYGDADDKYTFKHSDKELEDLFETIYAISSDRYVIDNKQIN